MCVEKHGDDKSYGKMPSKVKLETNWGMSVDENPIDYKIFREIWKIPSIGQIFLMWYLNSLCFPCLEN